MQTEEKKIIQTLYAFMSVALLGSIMIFVSAWMTYESLATPFAISGLIGILTCLSILWLLRLKQFFIPRIFLPTAIYLLASYLIFTGATVGIRDDAISLYALVVAMSGLLLGRKGVVTFGVLSVLAIAIAVLAEIFGYIGNFITPEMTTYSNLVNVLVIYGLTFLMMYILVNILTANLEKMRAHQTQVTEINQELWSIRETLEKQVQDRTRAAEIARAESESARRQAELQAWFTRGQAQLAEEMRGDLNLTILANNITSYLSRYIGAQTGALFAMQNNLLRLTGRYAYPENENHIEFALGEGLIGEAARSRKTSVIRAVAEDAPLIVSALGSAAPRQILVAALEWNGQVVGVLEFSKLENFTYEQEEFVRRISESVAIAMHTAQSRM